MTLARPPKSLRFLCRTYGNEFFVVEIPSIDVEYFQKLDKFRYIQHDHSFGEPFRFSKISIQPDILSNTKPIWRSKDNWPVAVGSVVYVLNYYLEFSTPDFTPRPPPTHHFLFQSINLDTRVTTILPAPFSPKRHFAKAIALRGKIFFFESMTYIPSNAVPQIFGDVFDTATNKWSILRNPPDIRLDDQPNIRSGLFIASLGETEGKLMVYYHPNREQWAIICFYDVIKDVWETHPCNVWPINDSSYDPDNEPGVRGMKIIREDDNTLYWIDENSFICAFDWKAKQFIMDPLLGWSTRRSNTGPVLLL